MTTASLVHPSNLLRSNSRERVFTAPRNINSDIEDSFDWGIAKLPFTKRMGTKYAKVSVFVTLLAILGFLQGVCYSYFGNTAKIWMKQFKFSETLTEYLIYSFHIICGVFGIFVAYWGNRMHRISWISGLAIFHSIAAISLLVPEWYHPSFLNFDAKKVSNSDILCLSDHDASLKMENNVEEKIHIVAGFFIIYQLFFSLAITSSICHGISYIDDHIQPKNSTVCICVLYSTIEFGRQIGLYYSYIPNMFQGHVFLSSDWLVNASLILIVASCISMFPKELPCKILERGVASILDLTVDDESDTQYDGFLHVMKTILTNPVIILTTCSAAIMSIAIINYEYMKKHFPRVKIKDGLDKTFTSYSEPSISVFFTDFIAQTFKVISAVIVATIITKFKPNLRSLIIMLASNYIKVVILFIAGIFMKCHNIIHTDYNRFVTFCNINCGCSLDDFYPVCVRGKKNITFYSPCHAGCFTKHGDTYEDCSCSGGETATTGYCDADNCSSVWILSEANNVFRSGLIAGTIIINILIIIKASPKSYKAVALGLYFSILQLTPYFPFRIFYNLIKAASCEYYNNQNVCTVYSKHFPLYMDIITTMLFGLAISLIFILLCFKTRELNIYKSEKSLSEINELSPMRTNNYNNNDSTHGSNNQIDEDEIDEILRDLDNEERERAGGVQMTSF